MPPKPGAHAATRLDPLFDTVKKRLPIPAITPTLSDIWIAMKYAQRDHAAQGRKPSAHKKKKLPDFGSLA